MSDITTFWTLPLAEQESIQKEAEQEAKRQEPAQLPARSTLVNVFDAGAELAVCASGLFILIVQDRYELGGGYGVQIIALSELINKHLETIEQVEEYLEATAPYKRDSLVWVPLPSYNSGLPETDFLKRLWEKQANEDSL